MSVPPLVEKLFPTPFSFALALMCTVSLFVGCETTETIRDAIKAIDSDYHSEKFRKTIRVKSENRKLLLFVHGYDSSNDEAWGQFPSFVLDDRSFDVFNLVLFGYQTEKCGNSSSIKDIGSSLKSYLVGVMPQYDAILLVGHSMGGLVIVSGLLDLDSALSVQLEKRSVAVATFGTPFNGAKAAGLLPPILCNDLQVRDLKPLNRTIFDLKVKWKERIDSTHVPVSGLSEIAVFSHYAKDDDLVPRESACDLFFAQPCEAVDGNHRTMVKPTSTEHLSFKKLKEVAERFDKPRYPTIVADRMQSDEKRIIFRLLTADRIIQDVRVKLVEHSQENDSARSAQVSDVPYRDLGLISPYAVIEVGRVLLAHPKYDVFQINTFTTIGKFRYMFYFRQLGNDVEVEWYASTMLGKELGHGTYLLR